MKSEKVNESEENQSCVQNKEGSKNCLIRISSSDDDDDSPEVENKQGLMQSDCWQADADADKRPKPPSESMAEENEEFPENESWWPHNDNSEWNLPKNVDNEEDQRNDEKPDSDYYEDYNDSSNFGDEVDSDKTYQSMEDEKIEYTSITFSRSSVHRDDPTDKFSSLTLGKVVKNKTYVVPKSCKPKFYINCTPKQYELASGNVFSKQSTAEMVFKERTNCAENEKWVFFKETTYCVNPLPPREYNTFSYEINTKCVFYVPVEIESDVEFYFGTIRDPKNVSA